jgi:hypothetical protein
MNEQLETNNASELEDEGRPLQLRVKEQEGEVPADPAQFAGQFADQFLSKKFAARWSSMLWAAMRSSGEGYRTPSMKNTGKGTDRRSDKLDGSSKMMRGYQHRYTGVNPR